MTTMNGTMSMMICVRISFFSSSFSSASAEMPAVSVTTCIESSSVSSGVRSAFCISSAEKFSAANEPKLLALLRETSVPSGR